MKRNIILIDEELCTGCEECIPNCPEGAIQIIDGKARLVGELFCDGLGACLGHCPEGAIRIEEREAEPYDERRVMENVVKQGVDTIKAHLAHLREHGEALYLSEALAFLKERNIKLPPMQPTMLGEQHASEQASCPGSQARSLTPPSIGLNEDEQPSHLRHWPIQLHLISPLALHYRGSDVLLAADCVAFALGGFHRNYLKGKTLAIACPKLDDGRDVYVRKITALVDEAQIRSLTVMIMQVPCCGGLLRIAQEGVAAASRQVPVRVAVVGIQGDILREEWVKE